MIEGGGSRNYIHTKKMMYNSPAAWDALMDKLVAVIAAIPPSKCAPAPTSSRSSTAGSDASASPTTAATCCPTHRPW